jgi:alpha-tubulin suppressor-like RCC1 family protein
VVNVATVSAIAAGTNHTLAPSADGRVACLGSDFTDRCGRIEITDRTPPLEIGPGVRVSQ